VSKSTGYRLLKAGRLPAPCLKEGRISRWSPAGLEQWAAGRDKHLTPDRVEALGYIKEMLGLERKKLTNAEEWSLLDKYHSVPYPHRLDPALLAPSLELILCSLRAVSRSESIATISESLDLINLVKEIQNVLNTIKPVR
jgi:hypothetical protein